MSLGRLLVTLGATVFTLVGCYSAYESERRAPPVAGYHTPGVDPYSAPHSGSAYQPTQPEAPPRARRFPWITWVTGYDLRGRPLYDNAIITGDALVEQGDYKGALVRYLAAKTATLREEDEEALVLRIAAVQLALDRSKEALSTLSQFFSATRVASSRVDSRFALLFAYAYSRAGDLEQGVAWFSQASRSAGGRGGMHEAASSGLSLLLRSVSDEQLRQLAGVWSGDNFANEFIGRETHRRTTSGVSLPDYDIDEPVKDPRDPPIAGGRATSIGPVIGALLPLSGEYAAIGISARNGIALAIEGQQGASVPRVLYEDTGGSVSGALASFSKLQSGGEARVVIGPVLASSAEAVGDLARRRDVAVIAMSRRSAFPTGGNIFRIAPTVTTQVDSLLGQVTERLALTRFALVYPDDQTGREYAAAFQQRVRAYGGEVVYQAAFVEHESVKFAELGDALQERQVQGVFFPGSLAAATRFVLALPENIRRSVTLMGTARWDDTQQLQRSRKALEGAVFVTPFFRESTNPYVSQFRRTYRAKFRQEPDFIAAQAFDVVTMVIAAIRHQEDDGRVSMAEALRRIQAYDGLTGRIGISPSGEFERNMEVVRLTEQGLEALPERKSPSYIMRGSHVIE